MKTIQEDFNTLVEELFDCTLVDPFELIGNCFFGCLLGMTLAVVLYVVVATI